MSTVLEQTPAVPADPPAPSSRSGSLLRAELHRFRSRRFLQVLLGLCVLGWIVATIIALTQFGVPTDDDRADARAQINRIVADNEIFRQQCLDDPEEFNGGQVPEGATPEELCGPPLTAADFRRRGLHRQGPVRLRATPAPRAPWCSPPRPPSSPSSSGPPGSARSGRAGRWSRCCSGCPSG